MVFISALSHLHHVNQENETSHVNFVAGKVISTFFMQLVAAFLHEHTDLGLKATLEVLCCTFFGISSKMFSGLTIRATHRALCTGFARLSDLRIQVSPLRATR